MVAVRTKKYIQTCECRPSSLLFDSLLNKEEILSVTSLKTCSNFSKEGLDSRSVSFNAVVVEHNSVFGQRYTLC